MNKTIVILFLCFINIIPSSYSAIYEEDDRSLVFLSKDSFTQKISQSVAAKLRTEPKYLGQNEYQILSKPLKDHIKNLCKEEKFENVETLSNCTSFLVAKDLMLTAGHCLNNQKECEESTWFFSDELNPYEKDPIVEHRNIYKCEKIISRIKNSISKNDYALFKLERQVIGREPLKFRKKGKVTSKDSFLVLGHPTGLALIKTAGSKVIENESEFLFRINSDTFGGNSGSPVFNQDTGLVEGILTDGDRDYKRNAKRGCMETYHCPASGCKGENVVRITNIPELVPDMTPIEPIIDLDNLRL
jgi:V8-like Glu-specific endopeptidase